MRRADARRDGVTAGRTAAVMSLSSLIQQNVVVIKAKQYYMYKLTRY